jgi:hypothetical protein
VVVEEQELRAFAMRPVVLMNLVMAGVRVVVELRVLIWPMHWILLKLASSPAAEGVS